jgi:ligand-binding sensor domain-containing protein/signal transduction histidine kinase
MMKMQLKSPLFILIVLVCHSVVFSQDIHFTTVNPPKDQPWSGIVDITQDPQGYLWFAAFNGLYKYDGHQYTFYQHESSNPNSLAFSRTESVFADKNGMIWIGTYGAGLDRFDPAKNVFTHYRHQANNAGSLGCDTVTAILQDREGILWLGTMRGVEKFDLKTQKFEHFINNPKDKASLSNNQVRIIYEDRQGIIWIGTGSAFNADNLNNSGGLNRLNKTTGKFTRYLHDANDKHSLIDNRVRAIFEDSSGTFWVGTAGDGLHTMDRKKGSFERHQYDPAHPEKLSRPPIKKNITYADDHITFIKEDISGKIWIGTFQGGINVYDPLTQRTQWYGDDPKSKERIVSNEFWNAYKTRDGIIWITPWQTTDFYKISPYQTKLPHNHIGKTVYAVMDDSLNSLWIGTNSGLIHQFGGNKEETFYMDKNFSSEKNPIYDIKTGDENKLWLATQQGLYQFDPISKTFTAYHHEKNISNSLNTDSTYCIKKGIDGKLWIGTYYGLDLMDTKSKTFKHFLNNPKDSTTISNNIINAIETDKNNNLWIGTANGLNKLDNTARYFKRYLSHDGVIYCILNDSQGNLFVGTNNGILKYDKNTDNFLIFNTEIKSVYGMTEDHEHNLWLNTNKGITKLNVQNNELNVYGINQGVNEALMYQLGYTRKDGQIVEGDTSGYFAFYPDKLFHRTPPPITIINKFLLADIQVTPSIRGVLSKPLLDTKKINLNHNQGTFSFGFNIIDYIEEGDIRSFYMLENYDSQWRNSGSDETANYYNIPPGNYTFKVKSINSDGQISEKRIDVIISSPWWQTWWAYLLFGFMFAGSIWAFIYYRSLSLIKEKRVLEHKVRIRTKEVMQQKGEIEAQRDNLERAFEELKTTQRQLIQSEKMASLGELTAGIAHEIQNPLNFVNNFSEVNTELIDEMQTEIDKGNLGEVKAIAVDIKENQQKINAHGKRADSIVKGMLLHSRANNSTREPTDINKLTDEYLRLSYHGLRAKDMNFNANLLTSFDPKLPFVNLVRQDIGRVLLNLFNNAFYAVIQKKKTTEADYKLVVEATTMAKDHYIEIRVKDNGNGIPEAIKDKIMQPFFTTKPTGEGTGLGLSLSYDIVVKGYGGKIDINTKEGEYAEFIVSLPV